MLHARCARRDVPTKQPSRFGGGEPPGQIEFESEDTITTLEKYADNLSIDNTKQVKKIPRRSHLERFPLALEATPWARRAVARMPHIVPQNMRKPNNDLGCRERVQVFVLDFRYRNCRRDRWAELQMLLPILDLLHRLSNKAFVIWCHFSKYLGTLTYTFS